MARFVVDASAAVEVLLRTRIGRAAMSLLEDSELYAPELLDAEVLAALRRAWLADRVSESRVQEALEDLESWPIRRVPHVPLLHAAWAIRHNISGYDAFYVAAAQRFDAQLLTADGPLSRAPGVGVVIHNLRA